MTAHGHTPQHKGPRHALRRFVLSACVAALLIPAMPSSAHATADIQLIRDNWVRAFMMMTEQLSAVMMQQVAAIGMFMDAKHQQETQRLFQEMTAQAHKDYQPSETLCMIGSATRSLGATQSKIRANAAALGAGMRRRELLNNNMASSWGAFADRAARLAQVRAVYCEKADNNNTFQDFCASNGTGRTNKDVNYGRTVDKAWTLNVDFTDDQLTDDETDVIALARNLYSHDVFTYTPETLLLNSDSITLFQDTRAVTAVRSVAAHSYATITAMKAPGTGLSANNIRDMAQMLGMSGDDVNNVVGANPSYYAQMEIMTQKLYQSPAFYVGLYDKPANVARIGVALRAMQIMADRDKYEASLRREMLVSLLLELKLRRYQEEVENRLTGKLPRTGPRATNTP